MESLKLYLLLPGAIREAVREEVRAWEIAMGRGEGREEGRGTPVEVVCEGVMCLWRCEYAHKEYELEV